MPPKLTSKLLADGQLTLEDGTVIKAEQVKEADSPSPNLLILHYNSVDSIVQVLKNPVFNQYLSNA